MRDRGRTGTQDRGNAGTRGRKFGDVGYIAEKREKWLMNRLKKLIL